MPGWKWTASPVAFAGLAHIDAVDRDRQTVSAHRLSGQRKHALEHREANRQISVEIHKGGQQIRRLHGDELRDGQSCRGLNTIKADRNAV
jgi:hypothetical protein